MSAPLDESTELHEQKQEFFELESQVCPRGHGQLDAGGMCPICVARSSRNSGYKQYLAEHGWTKPWKT